MFLQETTDETKKFRNFLKIPRTHPLIQTVIRYCKSNSFTWLRSEIRGIISCHFSEIHPQLDRTVASRRPIITFMDLRRSKTNQESNRKQILVCRNFVGVEVTNAEAGFSELSFQPQLVSQPTTCLRLKKRIDKTAKQAAILSKA